MRSSPLFYDNFLTWRRDILRAKGRINLKRLSGPLLSCSYCTTISKRTLMFAFAAAE